MSDHGRHTPPGFRLGDWTVREDINTVSNGRETHRLEARAVSVLSYLHRHRDRVVSKEELLEAVWQRTALSDHSVAVVISDLRRVLGDDSRAPKYIQTVPRRGYQLIAGDGDGPVPPGTQGAQLIPMDGAEPPRPAPREDLPPRPAGQPWQRIAMIAAALILLGSILVALFLGGGKDSPAVASRPELTWRPFTTLEGRSVFPAFSPDGRKVVFAWNHDRLYDYDLYVRDVASSEMVRLTEADGYDSNPAFSPDGQRIAFIRRGSDDKDAFDCGVYVMAAGGGPQRLIGPCAMRPHLSLTWLADNETLVYPVSTHGDTTFYAHSHLVAKNTRTGKQVQVTDPPGGGASDDMVAASPDGTMLAFRRFEADFKGLVYVLKIGPDGQPLDEPRRISDQAEAITDIDWMPDSRSLVLATSRGAPFTLWHVPLQGEGGREMVKSSAYIYGAAISPDGRTLILDQRDEAANLAVARLPAPGTPVPDTDTDTKERRGTHEFITRSTRFEWMSDIRADGARIAYMSDRTGFNEIWTARPDGTDERQLSRFEGTLGETNNPVWSPDGRQIAFTANEGLHSDIYLIGATGAPIRRVTDNAGRDLNAIWSADGSTLYFASDRTGVFQIWAHDLASGEERQITKKGGWRARTGSRPGELYVAKQKRSMLWRIETGSDTPPVPVLAEGEHVNRHFWAVSGDYLYTVELSDGGWDVNRRHLAAPGGAGESERVYRFPAPPFQGYICVSPDQRTLLYSAVSRYSGQLYMVEADL